MLTPLSTRYSAMQLKCKYENFKQIKTEMSEYVWIYRLNQSHCHEKSSLIWKVLGWKILSSETGKIESYSVAHNCELLAFILHLKAMTSVQFLKE